MGVVNVTPDSFYDGGRYLEPEAALDRCLKLLGDGADMLDIGGESSRPGAEPLSAEEELSRVLPVLESVRSKTAVPISVDTCKAAVAEAALKSGADIINDISSFRLAPDMPGVIARYGAGVVLMHMRGTPQVMQTLPPSKDILGEIRTQLRDAAKSALSAGIERDRIVFDPGIGFGKTVEDNLRILNQISVFQDLGFPVLLGTSRKSFIGKILGQNANDRLLGTAASVAVAILNGAHIVRVHDVKEMRMIGDVTDAVMAETVET